MKLGDFTGSCKIRESKIRALDAELDRIKHRLEKLRSVHYIDEVFKPLAAAIAKKIGAKDYEVLGPAGLGSHITLYFKKGRRELSVTVNMGNLYGDGSFHVIDMNTNTGEYPAGSLGAINGLNHPRITVPPKMPLATFIRKYVN